MEKITEMLKGILEGCILEIINRKDTYGYEITRQLRKFYSLNDAGREELRAFWEKWEFLSSKINELREKK